jgi:hypothetical protein
MLGQIHIKVENGRFRQRVCRVEDPPWAAELAVQHRVQRGALPGVRPVVDVARCPAATLMNGAWPFRKQCDGEAIEADVPDAPIIDQPDPAAFAETAAGRGVEVAGAPPVTIARDQHGSVRCPSGHRPSC